MVAVMGVIVNTFFFLFILNLIGKCSANDILGCGGFVISHAPLDYSKIEIGLYTKDGSLKEKTECAPTNGYYFLPLYEIGEYVLKVHPPPGWSFEPSEIIIDGSTDKCSNGQDVNFVFNGFGITGRVITAGLNDGPSGVSVQLLDSKGNKRETVTSAGGEFDFTPVIPGKYIVKASHPRWQLEPSQATIQVKEGTTTLPPGTLAVKGYSVGGAVSSYGNPIPGLYVVLYSKEKNPKLRVEGCNTALLQGVPGSPICHSVTDEVGEFNFGLVPAGSYHLLALSKTPGQVTVSYNIKPETVDFVVKHDSQFIRNAFEVSGFTVSGLALKAAGGGGVSGVRVLLDGQPAALTDDAGRYLLPHLQPGDYTVSFQHEQCELYDVKLSISANGVVSLPNTKVAHWKVCGWVDPVGTRDVLITDERSSLVHTVSTSEETEGKWCTFLPFGNYVVKVQVSEEEKNNGLQYEPSEVRVSVSHAPVTAPRLSRLTGRVEGTVLPWAGEAPRAAHTVTLRRLISADVAERTAITDSEGRFVFTDVLPGPLEASVRADRLCWARRELRAQLTGPRLQLPPFTPTGLALQITLSHDMEIEYTCGDSNGSWKLGAGVQRVCVPSVPCRLVPRGCHVVRPDVATVRVQGDDTPQVTFVATEHEVTVVVEAPVEVSDLTLSVTTSRGNQEVGPLPAVWDGARYLYTHSWHMAEGEVATVSGKSSSLLLEPSEPRQLVGRGSCEPRALVLTAQRGLTLAGRLVPAVEGALITLTADDLTLTQVTGPDGRYSFGPLDAMKQYSITAGKESYVMSEPGPDGVIQARKLAEITVELTDEETGSPLEGALVSLTGGPYRAQQAARADGRPRFRSLAPAHYYVKPLMKEYRFTPPHRLVALEDGAHETIAFTGSRVAWSAAGRVSTLGGAGAALAVRARADVCRDEHAAADTSGAFRIRGLLPDCRYTLELKDAPPGVRLLTPAPAVQITENKDIEDIQLLVIQPPSTTDVTVLVRSPLVEHYKTLRLKLAPADEPAAPVYTARLESAGFSAALNPGLVYVLPRLPADNATYLLTVESTLSKATHNYDEPKYYFNSDGQFKHFTIDFSPRAAWSSQPLRPSSAVAAPLLALVALAVYHRAALQRLLPAPPGVTARRH